jgi:hypothetical protein
MDTPPLPLPFTHSDMIQPQWGHTLMPNHGLQVGRCLRRSYRQSPRLPSRHPQDTFPVALVRAHISERRRHRRSCPLAWPLPRCRYSSAGYCTLVWHLFHYIRGSEVLIWPPSIFNSGFTDPRVPLSTRYPRTKQLNCTACQLCFYYSCGGVEAECANATCPPRYSRLITQS